MKQFNLAFLLTMLMCMVGARAFAYDAKIDGIYYNFSGSEATVTYQSYSGWAGYVSDYTGDIVIPNTVIYNGYTYNVTTIGYGAFNSCKTLTSVIIPNSVTSIDHRAFEDCIGLTSVTIPNSITTIAGGAFSNCSGLTSISVESGNPNYDSRNNCNAIIETGTNTLIKGCNNTIIPNGVTSIGNGAFINCTGLTSITIPNSVTSIGNEAFFGCSGLTSVTIPNNVTSIGYGAFRNCTGLTSITIPNSVTSIGNDAFYGCSGLTSINVESGNPNYDSRNNCNAIIETGTNTLIQGCNNTIIPNGVTSIDFGAFINCTGLTSVTIPNSVTTIGDGAFAYCSGLTSITIPNSVTTIGYNAFYGCSGLTSITIPNSVTSIGNQAFQDCNGLTLVTLHCESIDSWFSGLTLIKEVVIGDEVTTIGYGAFRNCTGLTSVTIGKSLMSIGQYAFQNCTGLTSVTFHCKYIGAIFSGFTSIKEVIIGDEVEGIGSNAFKGCSGLTSIIIPNSVTSIGYKAFEYCSGLTSVIIPNSVTTIDSDAFYNTKLKSAIIGSGVLSIGSNIFGFDSSKGNKPVKVIWLTNTPPAGYYNAAGTVNYVVNDSYIYFSNIKIYPFLSSIFEVDGIKYVPVSPSERTCDAIDCVYNESVENIVIEKNVSYKGVDMTVKNVNSYICTDNTFIKSLKMVWEGDISDYAFQGCSALQSVTLNDKISSIGSYAFDNCSSLKDIVIPNSITTIGNNAFSNTGLTSITIPNSVATIGSSAFRNCTGITSITIPNSVKSIGNDAFAECNGLTLVTLYCESIGSWFSGLTSIIQVVTGDEVTSIGDSAFKGCTKLKDVNISEGVKAIGDWAFSGCNSLDHFVSGSKVESIGQGAFSGCTAMTKLISRAATPPVCGAQALDDINKWNCKLQVPEASIPAYQAADQWKDFFFIEPTGINEIKEDVTRQYRYYDLNGNQLLQPHKGVNIVKSSDGKTKKVMVK